MKSFLFYTVLMISLCLIKAPIAEAKQRPEVILSGDSWAFLPCLFQSAHHGFRNRDIDVSLLNCLKTSKAGGRANTFKNSAPYKETLKLLSQKPRVKAVYLSLGGNDIFKYWTKTMTPAEETQLFEGIRTYIEEIVDDFHAVRPDVKVLVSGYDYIYMYDKNPIKVYQEVFEHMGKPNPDEVNGALERLSLEMTKMHRPNTFYQHHIGLMHYHYGVPEAKIPKHETLRPSLISPPHDPGAFGGIHTARSSKHAMATVAKVYFDPHHLRPAGYVKLFEHAIDAYLGQWLK